MMQATTKEWVKNFSSTAANKQPSNRLKSGVRISQNNIPGSAVSQARRNINLLSGQANT